MATLEEEDDGAAPPLLVALPVAAERTADMQLKNYMEARPHDFSSWSHSVKERITSAPGHMQQQLLDMLPAVSFCPKATVFCQLRLTLSAFGSF